MVIDTAGLEFVLYLVSIYKYNFAFIRPIRQLTRDTACSCCWAPAVQQLIDGHLLPLDPQQQTRRTLLQRSIDGIDERIDRQTP